MTAAAVRFADTGAAAQPCKVLPTLMRVDLPAPLGPMHATRDDSDTCRCFLARR